MTLSMSKLLKNAILLSSLAAVGAYASSSKELLKEYLTNQLENNPAVKKADITVLEEKPLSQVKGWNAYIVNVSATLKRDNKNIHQRNIFFSNGRYIASDFVDMRTGDSLKEKVKPKFDPSFYKEENLISGSKNSRHKIALFSDPLCPFCRRYVPQILKEVQKDPKKFAVYYYHLPLPRIHPASVILVKAMIAAQLKGKKPDLMKLYTQIQPDNPKGKHYVAYREQNVGKILKVFNEVMGTNLQPKDLKSKEVEKRFKADIGIVEDLMVGGTPTVYFDGEYDRTKRKYKSAK